MNRLRATSIRTLQIVALTILGMFSTAAETNAAGTNARACCANVPMTSCGCCSGPKSPATNPTEPTLAVMAQHHTSSGSQCECSAQAPALPSSKTVVHQIRTDWERDSTASINPIDSEIAAEQFSFTQPICRSGVTKHPIYLCICRLTI